MNNINLNRYFYSSLCRCGHCLPFFWFLNSWDEEAEKVMGMSVFSELFYWFRVALFSAGTKIIAGIILLSVSATLFLSPSLRVCFFFSLCSVYALLFSSVPPLLTLRGWYRPAVSLLWVFFFFVQECLQRWRQSQGQFSVYFSGFMLCFFFLCSSSGFWVYFFLPPLPLFCSAFYRARELAPNC